MKAPSSADFLVAALAGLFAAPAFCVPASAETAGLAQTPDYSAVITIDQAVREGLQFDLELLAARYNISTAEADELTAGLRYNPALSAAASLQPFGGNWKQADTGGPAQLDLSLIYPLDFTGKRGKRVKSAREARKAAEASFQNALRLKTLEIRASYIDIVSEQGLLELSKEKEANLRKLVRLIQSRIGRKDILPLLQVRAQLELDQAALSARRKESSVRAAKISLALLLGRAPSDASVKISAGLGGINMLPLPDRERLIQDAFSSRPDMTVLRLTRSKFVQELSLARAQVWDNLALSAGYTFQRSASANPDDPASKRLPGAPSWSGGLSLPLPLFNRSQGNIRKAEFLIAQTDKQTTALELSIRAAINTVYDRLFLARELIQQYESSQLKNAQTVRDAQQKLFGTGGHALLEYFDAIRAYNDTLAAYYTALADYRRAAAGLNAAAGKDILVW